MSIEKKGQITSGKPEISITVGKNDYYLLNKEDEEKIEKMLSDVTTFIKENDGKGKSESEKDELYGKSQELWHKVGGKAGYFNNIEYNLVLNRPQYNFLTDLLIKKIEFDVNTVFYGIELSKFLSNMKKDSNGFTNDVDPIEFAMTATDMTYLYTILTTYKPVGLTKKTYLFAEVLTKIGMVSKIINYYDNEIKELSEKIQKWVYMFDPNVVEEDVKKGKISESESTRPKPPSDRKMKEGETPTAPKSKN